MDERYKIGIVGLGLIGGSLALALREGFDVCGFDSDERTREYASAHGFCKIVNPDAMTDCDVIFACVPVSAMSDVLKDLTRACPNAIVTDVASVKVPFSRVGGRYVGGHPMAGTERGGIAAAKPHLFENAYWVLTGGDGAETVFEIVKSIGAIPLYMTAEEHDRAVAEYSHTPHAVAYALCQSAISSGASPIVGSGFLDTTRIAKSDASFWSEVFLKNADNVSSGIRYVIAELEYIDSLITRGKADKLRKYIEGARQKRIALDRADLGGETLYVDLVDRVGEFERVTGAIASAGINVTGISLVPGREGASGALRLEFDNAADRARAKAVLKEKSYAVSEE